MKQVTSSTAFSERIDLEQGESSYGTGSARFFAQFDAIRLVAIAPAVKREHRIVTTNGGALRARPCQLRNENGCDPEDCTVPRKHQPLLTPLDRGRCAPARSGSAQRPGATWPGFLASVGMDWTAAALFFMCVALERSDRRQVFEERDAARLPIGTVDGQRTCNRLAAGKSVGI